VEIKTVGIDIGKTWFHLVACNQAGKPISRHKPAALTKTSPALLSRTSPGWYQDRAHDSWRGA